MKMCSKYDVLNWDELDLDDLLVDYTDYDRLTFKMLVLRAAAEEL